MDKEPDIVVNFEELLKKHTSRRPTVLYSSSKNEKNRDYRNKIDYNPKDVIRNISAQIKAMQNADVTSKRGSIVLENHKTSNFIPVNKLQTPVVPQTKAAKFETQFVLDTQLMNVIEDVEAMSTHKGITQEFDSTFDHTNIDLINNRLKPPDHKFGNCSKDSKIYSSVSVINSPDVNIIIDNKVKSKTHEDSKDSQPIINVSQELHTKSYKECELTNNNVSMDDHCTELLDRCMEIEETVDIQDLITDTEIDPSPIIIIKRVDKSNSTPPLVYNLDSFEKFEQIALPIIEENNDIDTVKHLINSQIIGKELFIQTNYEPEISKRKESLSPVLKITRTPKINIKKENLVQSSASNIKLNDFKETPNNICKDSRETKINIPESSPNKKNDLGNTLDNILDVILKDEKKSVSYEDEILFSSDEENDFKETNIQDIPFTCALEASFYEHSDVLDTTMYVGFQTASNKSIQVSTVSFTKAKSILDDDIDSKVKIPTLKELVEKCETTKPKITFISENTAHDLDTNKMSSSKADKNELEFKIDSASNSEFPGLETAGGQVIEVSDMDKAKCLFNDMENDIVNKASQDKFGGFKTASNKNINLSEKALQRCKRVFQDIDLNDDFCDENLPCEQNNPCNKKIKLSSEHSKATVKDITKTAEKETLIHKSTSHSDIPKIDEDILQEFEGETSFNDCKDDVVNQFVGFKTASNKNIKISENAFQKSKKIFDDIDIAETSNIKIKQDFINSKLNLNYGNLNEENSTVGFKTASNKIINISDKALARTKNIFQDIDLCDSENISSGANVSKKFVINESNIKNDIKDRNSTPVITDTKFVGFKTASNKTITISEVAFSKCKNIFKDFECNDIHDYGTENQIDDEMIKIAENIDFIRPSTSKENVFGFKAANNKNIAISAAALKKTKNMFQAIDNSQVESNNNFTEEQDIVKLIQDKQITEEFDEDFRPSSDLNEPCSNLEADYYKQDRDNVDNNKVIGFQTAGDKPIKISKEALFKSNTLFRDILNDSVELQQVEGLRGFHTASNKNIQISDVALAKSRIIFKDMEEIDDKNILQQCQMVSNRNADNSTEAFDKRKNNNSDKDHKHLNDIQLSPVFKGYQTATGTEVKTTAAALAISKKIFDDIDKVEKVENNEKTPVFKGFQVGNDRKIFISDEALAKSKKIFDDLNKDNEKLDAGGGNPVFKGFQTASNKEVKISDQALAKGRKMFEDLDKDIIKVDEVEKNNTTPVFKGFQTANNKQVKISAAALAKSRKIFEDLGTIESDTQITKVVQNKSDLISLNKNDKATTSFKGFQTASNKEVKISAGALEKSKKILENIDVVNENEKQFYKDTTQSFLGFQTANNGKVEVSAEALVKSKKLFEGLVKENEGVANKEPLIPVNVRNEGFPLPFKGFNTASNKEANVSADALAKRRKVFQDLNEFKENEEINVFKGFQTGSNKKVVISEEALAKSRQILSDIKVNENLKPAFGFKTANNNNVKISEEAVLQSRKLLTDIDHTDDIPNSCVIKLKTDLYTKTKSDINIDKLIDTQVMKNFDESLNTEDFKSPENRSKRSGSPILSCPRAKKRKFATPYKTGKIENTKTPVAKAIEIFDDSYKKHKKYTLKDIAKLENINTNSEANTDFDINLVNLDNFEFTDKRNDISDSKMSLEELKVIFLKTVKKTLVPDGWYKNHIKLILWKLISYEKKFPKTMSGICTAKNALLQLKYRYHKELYSAERPALRKILERDDVASKMLVLCVMEIYNEGGDNSTTNPPELLLTDGWYCIRTCIDKMLIKYVSNGKITVGTKLVIHGAELVNCEQGIAPWEDTSSVRLKIFGNSTRRARWDARLGFHGNSSMVSHLSSLKPEGGKVSSLRVYVTRVYPPLYVEKFEDGSTVTRSERLEHIHQMKYESDRQALVEKVYEEVEKEMSDEESPDLEDVDISKRSLDSGSQIARLMKMSKEPSQFRANLTESQRRLLESYTASKRDKVLQDIQERIRSKLSVLTRNVVPLLKVRIAELHNGKIFKALLSIWKPNDALSELITEGAYIEILNAVPTAVRYSELQISAGRQSVFKQMKKLPEILQPYIKTINRTCYPIKEIISHPNMVTDYNEIDTIGVAIQIDPSYKDFTNTNQFQNVYLADEEKNIICVNFWGGIKKFGYENVLDTGQIVACVNLQKRAGNTRKSIPQYRATEFTYFTKTPKSVGARKLIEELTKKVIKNMKSFIDECIVVKNNLLKSNISNEISPYRFHNHDLSKNKIYIESPLARIQPKIQEEFNLSGLDFESTFRQTEPQELSPKSLLRKKRVHEKISKLKMYGEPPPLSPINIINKSINATKSFKSPLLNSSVASKCDPVANVKKLPESMVESEINCSPVLGVNRTLKKSMNPVKLDFNKVAIEENDIVDHFAEEFDASPPLSLD